MKVRDRMTSNVLTTSPDCTVGELWRLMIEKDLRRIPVVDRGKLLAIVTRRDFGARPDLDLRRSSVAARFFSNEQEAKLNKIKVRDIIPVEQQLVTIYQDAYIEQAASLLRVNKIGGMPVIDDNGKLVGIITQSDIFDAFLDTLGVNLKGTRICLRVGDEPEAIVKIGTIIAKYNARIDNMVMMEAKDEKSLMIIRINILESRPLVADIKTAGFVVESVIVKH
ncbi:MAG: CBS and ACT domain-containing protein [Syntrophomonadaceae bacterium]|nr:CBS and ACT domain-containing protein [Syntrophomonadaceae bacterium]MDD3022762.1 CBS and ACT domain-containing protein [Syntrophomonadaceae bacterium]